MAPPQSCHSLWSVALVPVKPFSQDEIICKGETVGATSRVIMPLRTPSKPWPSLDILPIIWIENCFDNFNSCSLEQWATMLSERLWVQPHIHLNRNSQEKEQRNLSLLNMFMFLAIKKRLEHRRKYCLLILLLFYCLYVYLNNIFVDVTCFSVFKKGYDIV